VLVCTQSARVYQKTKQTYTRTFSHTHTRACTHTHTQTHARFEQAAAKRTEQERKEKDTGVMAAAAAGTAGKILAYLCVCVRVCACVRVCVDLFILHKGYLLLYHKSRLVYVMLLCRLLSLQTKFDDAKTILYSVVLLRRVSIFGPYIRYGTV
jgi:hypothetical protein